MLVLSSRAYLSACFHLIVSTVLVAATVSAVRAQGGGGTEFIGTGGRHTIQGRIYFPSGRKVDFRAKVKLETTSAGTLSVFADLDGAFKFTNLTSGSYSLVIEAGEEYEIATESIYIEGNSSLGRGTRMPTTPRTVMVPIYLQPKRGAKANARPGVINAALASVPKEASELYLNALQSLQAGDTKKAISQLQTAISLHPQFPLALNELGVQYLKLHDADKAVEVLQRAVKAAPESATPRLNFGIALLEKKRWTEAETELRHVLKINDNTATAHYYLGIALLNLKNYSEAEKEFQRTVGFGNPELSLAHYYLGGIYWRNHDYKQAADQLEKYLQLNPKATDGERIRSTIKELRAKQSN